MRLKSGFASLLDQAWLSVLNLAISFAFIRFATKDDFGVYLLLMTPLYLILGVQNALILSPLTTIYPSSASREKPDVLRTAIASQIAFVSLSALLSSIGLASYWYIAHGTVDLALTFGFGLAIAGVCARESVRTLFYVKNNAMGALSSDVTYGVGLLLFIAVLCYMSLLTPQTALVATGIAALWTYIFKSSSLQHLRVDRKILASFWGCGRWALVGVLVTWINLSAYPLIVAHMLSNSIVADINVARLILMPVGLCATAWSNIYRPKISALAIDGQLSSVGKLSIKSIFFGVSALSLFTVALVGAYPYIELILGKAYSGLLPLVLFWSLFFALNISRTILMATLMTAERGYKQLQGISWVALCVSLTGLWLLSPRGALWVIGVLIAVEMVQCILIGITALRWWRVAETKYE